MLVYKIRENDIVSNRSDLEQSIINNLSVFFDALAPKFQYKISLVSSITTKDGTNIKGGSHKVLVSTSKTGIKKYKTIYNKWAVLDISLSIDGGAVKKLERIVLAPVDITKYSPSLGDLDTQSNSIGILISSGLIAAPEVGADTSTQIETPETKIVPTPIPKPGSSQAVTPAKPTVTTAPQAQKPGSDALTLFDWYQAHGWALPTVSVRALLFENLGIGPSGTYVGTAEQNNSLLAKLKAQDVTPASPASPTVAPIVKTTADPAGTEIGAHIQYPASPADLDTAALKIGTAVMKNGVIVYLDKNAPQPYNYYGGRFTGNPNYGPTAPGIAASIGWTNS